MAAVGARLMENTVRERRAQLGMTQIDLAQRLGVSRQTIISIERGRCDPSLPLAFKLATANFALLGFVVFAGVSAFVADRAARQEQPA